MNQNFEKKVSQMRIILIMIVNMRKHIVEFNNTSFNENLYMYDDL